MDIELNSFTAEERQLIEDLRANGKLLETDDEDVTVPGGVTHILLLKLGQKPKLIRVSTDPNLRIGQERPTSAPRCVR